MAKFQCNVISYTLKRTVDVTVVIPTPTIPESFNVENPPKHTPAAPYPVLYLLHGTGNNHATWTGYTKAELYAEEHQIAIVNLSAENLDYVHYEGRDDFFTFLSEELPEFVTGLFPVSKRVEDTYIAGLSMGGYGTTVHALNHPERFTAFGVFSGGLRQCPKDEAEIDGSMAQETNHYGMVRYVRGRVPKFSPYALARKLKAEGTPFPKAYVACGTKDPQFTANKEYAAFLTECGADVTFDEVEGYGHEWRFWDLQVEKFMEWLPRTDAYAGKKRKV